MGISDDFEGDVVASFGPQAGSYLLESCLHQRIGCYVMMVVVMALNLADKTNWILI